MELIAYLIVGLATGLLCRFIVPGFRRIRLIRMGLIGMVGGGFGGAVAGTFYTQREPFAVALPTLIGAFLGALLAVFVLVSVSRKRVHA